MNGLLLATLCSSSAPVLNKMTMPCSGLLAQYKQKRESLCCCYFSGCIFCCFVDAQSSNTRLGLLSDRPILFPCWPKLSREEKSAAKILYFPIHGVELFHAISLLSCFASQPSRFLNFATKLQTWEQQKKFAEMKRVIFCIERSFSLQNYPTMAFGCGHVGEQIYLYFLTASNTCT